MKIRINDHTTIAVLQKEFNGMFPFLKLEFFSRLHKVEQPSHLKFLQQPDKALGEIRKTHSQGEIEITPEMKVSELEQLFGQEFGLGVQVFRKSGNSWLETVLTDNWTLFEQNSEGEILSTRIRPETQNYDDDIE